MRAGDRANPLVARASYIGSDDQLDLPLATPAVVTVRMVGSDDTDTPLVDSQPISIISSADGVVTFSRPWGPGETDTPGRYTVTIVVTLAGLPLTFPTSGRSVLEIEPA